LEGAFLGTPIRLDVLQDGDDLVVTEGVPEGGHPALRFFEAIAGEDDSYEKVVGVVPGVARRVVRRWTESPVVGWAHPVRIATQIGPMALGTIRRVEVGADGDEVRIEIGNGRDRDFRTRLGHQSRHHEGVVWRRCTRGRH
jgi:hypothetical protein